jgi:putative mRNA 3-end processing factor
MFGVLKFWHAKLSLFDQGYIMFIYNQTLKNEAIKVASLITYSQKGIIVRSNGKRISLDPMTYNYCDLTFVSHAHTDHMYKKSLHKNCKTTTLVSKTTSILAKARGYDLAEVTEDYDGLELIDTGHILGSKGLLIGHELFYTGDISIRERAFMKPACIPSANTLIIESTFGRPEYIFPSLTEILDATNRIISQMYDLGVPVLLMGYSLGKAQLLAALFDHWEPVFVHDSIYNMNTAYSKLGIQIKDMIPYSIAEKAGLIKRNEPWVMIAPLSSARNSFVRQVKQKYKAVTIGFSGWAVNSRYKYMMGLDYTMPISDHCDYNELIRVVTKCNPKKVYTVHGFADDLAMALTRMGFEAEPLNKMTGKKPMQKVTPNSSLDLYFK